MTTIRVCCSRLIIPDVRSRTSVFSGGLPAEPAAGRASPPRPALTTLAPSTALLRHGPGSLDPQQHAAGFLNEFSRPNLRTTPSSELCWYYIIQRHVDLKFEMLKSHLIRNITFEVGPNIILILSVVWMLFLFL